MPIALCAALRPLFPFRQAQYVQVFPLKSAPFCTLFAGLASINKFAISLLFSFYLTLVLSSPPCPLLHLSSYLKLGGRSGRNCLLSLHSLTGYNGSPDSPPCPLLHLSFYLKLAGRSGRKCFLFSCSIRLQWVPGHSFLPGNDAADELARRGALLAPSAVSFLSSLVFTLLFSRTGGVLSHRNSLTHKFPRFPLRNLCSLVMLAVFSLVYAATHTAFC